MIARVEGNSDLTKNTPHMEKRGESILLSTPVVCLVLALLVAAIYFPAVSFDFVHMDDAGYIRNNPVVQGGVNSRAALDAFQVFNKEYWVPVLWFSLMLDAEIFGTGPAGFHFTNILLHLVNVILLFFLMRRLTGSRLLGFVIATLFAVHPQRVESVAWITARKDVLYTPFLLLAIFSYLRFVQTRQRGLMVQTGALQLLSLMAKPAAITLPGLLLALDIWPLKRWHLGVGRPLSGDKPSVPIRILILEKLPLLAISVVFASLTLYIQREAVYPLEGEKAILQRLGMASLAFLVYLKNLLWPSFLGLRFSVSNFPTSELLFGIVVFVALCLSSVLAARRWPHLSAGWIWFVGAMLPISGIVAVGSQWMSDRFTYVPHMLLLGSLVVTGGNIAKKRRAYSILGILIALSLVFAWSKKSREQLWTWENPLTLARRSVQIAPWHAYAVQFLGQAHVMMGETAKAIDAFEEVIRQVPEDHEAHFRLSYAYSKQDRIPEAMEQLRETIRYKPSYTPAYYHLAEFLYDQGDFEDAARQYETFLDMVPDFLERDYLHSRAGYSRLQLGQAAEAERHFRLAVEEKPENAEHHFNLAMALFRLGRTEEATVSFEKALELDPKDLQTRLTLAEALYSMGRGQEARIHFEKAIKQAPAKAEESFARGRILELDGKQVEAARAYREGLGREAVLPKVLENLEDSLAALSADSDLTVKSKK